MNNKERGLEKREEENNNWLIPPGLKKTVQDFHALFDTHYEGKTTALPLMIVGDRGVGKTLFLHLFKTRYRKNHPNKKIVYLNAATIPETLAESELFGYEAGAFSDAKKSKPGLVEEADLLVLEEIGELPKFVQAKLLTFIENGMYYRLGGTAPQPTKRGMQIIATTNRSVEYFREDFYDRFFKFFVPAIHQRRVDVLCHLDAINPNLLRSLNTCEIMSLLAHNWPGNVREIERIEQEITWRRAAVEDDPFWCAFPLTPKCLSNTQTDYSALAFGDFKNGLEDNGVDLTLLESVFNDYGLGFDMLNGKKPFSEVINRERSEQDVAFDQQYSTKSYIPSDTMCLIDKGIYFIFPSFFLTSPTVNCNLFKAGEERKGFSTGIMNNPLNCIENPGPKHEQMVRSILQYIVGEELDAGIPFPSESGDPYLEFLCQSTHGRIDIVSHKAKHNRPEDTVDILSMTEDELLDTYYRKQRDQAKRTHGTGWVGEVSNRTGIKKEALYKRFHKMEIGKKSTKLE
jgi:hypothetical protein